MTDEQIIREVAEKVMGWKAVGWNGQRFTRWQPDKPPSFNMTDWDPLHDLNHAFMVVERIRVIGWAIRIWSYATGMSWGIRLEGDTTELAGKVIHEAGYPIGHAICLAALKAVEK